MSAGTVPADPTGATYLLQSQANVGNRRRLQSEVQRVPIGLSTLAPGVAIYTGGNLTPPATATISGPLQNGQPVASTNVYGNFTGRGNWNTSAAPLDIGARSSSVAS